MSALTVVDVNRTIGSLFNSSDFKPYLNQAIEQLTISGRWDGALVYVTFDSSTGFITLPYEYASILGVNVDYGVNPIFSQFHRYLESGPGKLDETKPTPGFLMDMGDGYATLVDPPTADSTLQIVLTAAGDIGQIIRLYGTSSGVEVFDSSGVRGMNVTTTGLTTNVATVFDVVTGIECPVNSTTGAPTLTAKWYLYSVAPDTTTTLLSTYYPPDIRPSYHRYQLGTTTKPITCLCQRRFIPIYSDYDWVIPGNIRAIKAAMQAVQCEDANNYEQAMPLWATAYDILNKMTHSTRGAAKPELNFMPWGSIPGLPDIN